MHEIILVDDHSLFREGIKLLIETEGLGKVVAEAENGQKFLDLLPAYHLDLVIMDIAMPVMGGMEATQRARSLYPDLKVLALTMFDEEANYLDMVYAGAMGFILKTAGKRELERAIKAITEGESFYSTDLLRRIILNQHASQSVAAALPSTSSAKITENELEVLRYFCQGLTVSEIAVRIFRSVKTVEGRRSSLLHKTNSKNTINLILYAIKNKLIELEDIK
jgi:DNA-binding NarL/FixJ family response regulator